MSRRDTMRDPFYAPILLEIERTLHEADRLAGARNLTLTDSNVRSLLVRAVNEAGGKAAKAAGPGMSEKDRFLAEALQQLTKVRAALRTVEKQADGSDREQPLPAADWIAALEAIKDSCATRSGTEPGSRGYLDFLKGFIRQTLGRS